jgi:mutator protein MutT
VTTLCRVLPASRRRRTEPSVRLTFFAERAVSDLTAHIKVTAALILDRDRLFIGQRPPSKRFGLLWEFPGGKVEPGESLEASLEREIREELALEVAVGAPFRCVCHRYRDFHIELHSFWCAVVGGTLRLREHVACRWVRRDELDAFPFTDADRQLVAILRRLPEFPVYGQEIPST